MNLNTRFKRKGGTMVAKTNQELDRLQKLSRTAEELVRGGNRTPEQISHLSKIYEKMLMSRS
jgi:hypothetical protein